MIQRSEAAVSNDAKLRNEVKVIVDSLKQMFLDQEIQDKIRNQPSVPDPVTEKLWEPQILFLGTQAMKPTIYRGASAIYVFNKRCAVLMDCAEGAYG